MGEAARRKKLDPNYGQNYPASEENWICGSFPGAAMEVGNLEDCLFRAGITTKNKYLKFKKHVFEKLGAKSAPLFLSKICKVRVDDELYKTYFEKAVKKGEININIGEEEEEFVKYIAYNIKEADEIREFERIQEEDNEYEDDEELNW
ncbi:MAG: hypothetical protein QNJ18_08815 [Xenococcaceae cyanobacterium MO_167.B52]|nr:hypothetical protein [Xenococcaceae cyanobacterium MO_167.B52]